MLRLGETTIHKVWVFHQAVLASDRLCRRDALVAQLQHWQQPSRAAVQTQGLLQGAVHTLGTRQQSAACCLLSVARDPPAHPCKNFSITY